MPTVAENWMLLKDGSTKVAHQRLSDFHQLITTCVSQFHDDASAQVEGLEGPSEEGLGLELFKVLSDLLMVAFPEEYIAEQLAREAIKAFRDTLVAGVSKAAAVSAAGRLAQAKDELRRVLNDLVAATRDSAAAAWREGIAKVPESLQAFFDANPNHHNLPYDENANAMEEWLSDSIGIRDAFVANPCPEIIEGLWTSFHKDYYRVSARLRWNERSFTEKYQFLTEMNRSQRPEFVRMMGENWDGWWVIGLSWHDRSLGEKRAFMDGFENDWDRQQFLMIIGLDLDTWYQMIDEALHH
jgi:hypothetical protein